MSPRRLTLAVVLLPSLLLGHGLSLLQPPPAPTPASKPPPAPATATAAQTAATAPTRPAPPPSDPQATAILDRAVTTMAQLANYEARFSQVTTTDDLAATMAGVYVVGAGRRVRFELNVQRGTITGSLKIVCDGQQLWRFEQTALVNSSEVYPLATFDEEISNLTIEKQTALEEKMLSQLRRDLQAEHGLLGVTLPLEDLRQHVRWSPPQRLKLPDGRDMWELTGEWSQAFRDQLFPAKKGADPKEPDLQELWDQNRIGEFLPRRCRLQIDAATHFPAKLEWLGPRPRFGEVVLSRLEWQVTPLTSEQAQERCRLTPAERAQDIRQGDFKAVVKQRLDFLIRQQQMEEEIRRRQLQQQESGSRPPEP